MEAEDVHLAKIQRGFRFSRSPPDGEWIRAEDPVNWEIDPEKECVFLYESRVDSDGKTHCIVWNESTLIDLFNHAKGEVLHPIDRSRIYVADFEGGLPDAPDIFMEMINYMIEVDGPNCIVSELSVMGLVLLSPSSGIEHVRAIIDAGATVPVDAISLAARRGWRGRGGDVVDLLAENGASVNVLHDTVMWGQLDMTRAVVALGADTSFRGQRSYTPIMFVYMDHIPGGDVSHFIEVLYDGVRGDDVVFKYMMDTAIEKSYGDVVDLLTRLRSENSSSR